MVIANSITINKTHTFFIGNSFSSKEKNKKILQNAKEYAFSHINETNYSGGCHMNGLIPDRVHGYTDPVRYFSNTILDLSLLLAVNVFSSQFSSN